LVALLLSEDLFICAKYLLSDANRTSDRLPHRRVRDQHSGVRNSGKPGGRTGASSFWDVAPIARASKNFVAVVDRWQNRLRRR